MDGLKKVTATFALPQRVLTVTKSGTGAGSVTADSGTISWAGNQGAAAYNIGTAVILTATPEAGSVFAGWYGGGCSGTGTCEVSMGADQAVVAEFKLPLSGQAYTSLPLDLSSQTILQNSLVDAAGKLSRLPDNGDDLSGLTVSLTVTAPDSTQSTSTTTTNDQYGHYSLTGLTGFTQKGVYKVKAVFAGSPALTGSSSEEQSVLVGGSSGYAVIVEGRLSNNEGLHSHNKTANRIYKALKDRGFTDDDISYFNYNTKQAGVDAVPSKAAIQAAIGTWAKDKMNSSPAPLYIIMVDHGNPNNFYINNETITPDDMSSWLDSLESGLSSKALEEKRVVIIGSCYSGSFIPAVSGNGRVVVTSAAENEESYKGANEPDGVRSGEFFLDELFKQLWRGSSLKKAFAYAADKTKTYTRKGGIHLNSGRRYRDGAVQHPLLDDNADRQGSNPLSDDGDGLVADVLFMGVGALYDTNSADNPAELTAVTETLFLAPSASSALLWSLANDNSEVSAAWMEIRKPSKILSSTGGSYQLELDIPKEFMTLNASNSHWEKTYNAFDESGTYEVFYYVRDAGTGDISPMTSLDSISTFTSSEVFLSTDEGISAGFLAISTFSKFLIFLKKV